MLLLLRTATVLHIFTVSNSLSHSLFKFENPFGKIEESETGSIKNPNRKSQVQPRAPTVQSH